MKNIFSFSVFIIFLSCNTTHEINDCNKVSEQVKLSMNNFYNNINDSLMQGSSMEMRWNTLISYLCKNIDLEDKFMVLEKSANISGEQEGLLNVGRSDKYYYFKRNGKDVYLKIQSNELQNFKKLMENLKPDFNKLAKGIISDNKNIIVTDAFNINLLAIDLRDEKKSGFYSLKNIW